MEIVDTLILKSINRINLKILPKIFFSGGGGHTLTHQPTGFKVNISKTPILRLNKLHFLHSFITKYYIKLGPNSLGINNIHPLYS